MRVKAVIAYDGSLYQGFQRQKSTDNTVATALEKALRELQIDSPVTGSGRTDRGVHATGQVIHFDLPPYWHDLAKLQTVLNRKLSAIRFKHLSRVPDSFHARFSAQKRTYRYLFKTERVSVFERNYCAHYDTFDAEILRKALSSFQGEHDFSSFHKTGSQIHTTIREIYHTDYRQRGAYHFLYFTANGFLRSQVRMMVEAAMQCARKELSLETLEVLIGGRGEGFQKLAPPQGLYLAHIGYPSMPLN
jgi:tRNA pseudouridine38-40 synthase